MKSSYALESRDRIEINALDVVIEETVIIEIEMTTEGVTIVAETIEEAVTDSEIGMITEGAMTIETETIEEAVTDSTIGMIIEGEMIDAEEMISGVATIENVEPTPITIGNVRNVTTPITHSEPNATAVESRKEEVAEDHNESGKVMIEEQGTERKLLHLGLAIGNVHNVVSRILQSATNASDVVGQRE